MRRRRLLIGIPLVVVLGLAVVVGVFLLRGGNEPPLPALSAGGGEAGTASAGAAEREGEAGGTYAPARGSFVGYRVRETFASIGVTNAVGRTAEVTGTVRVAGERITDADLTADLTALRSDESRRDDALRTRGIETDRFPSARFALTEPVRAVPSAGGALRATADGRLTLHGRTRPVRATLQAQRAGERIELVGSTPITFAEFGIRPPSVAGFVTVRDEGLLEFRLLLAPR
jgi:polyisoprenoid-binding protein YceI